MLLTALYIAQEQHGSLTDEAIRCVADRLGLPPNDVYETATFYSMFHTEPVGRHLIQVCEGLSCFLAGGAERLIDHLQEDLGVPVGGTTPDGLFTLEAVQCLAACDRSPAMRVDDTLYTDLTAERVSEVLASLRQGG
jgi:NADH-quinone oxidoreductase subunit E